MGLFLNSLLKLNKKKRKENRKIRYIYQSDEFFFVINSQKYENERNKKGLNP